MPGRLEIYRGIPGSGKTTVAMTQQAINIDRDMFRIANGYGVTPDPAFEGYVTNMQDAIIEDALSRDLRIIESSTNLNPRLYNRWVKLANKYNAELCHLDFDVDPRACIARNYNRALDGGHYVSEEKIMQFYNSIKDGFPAFPDRTPIPFSPYVPDLSKPLAYMVDIDGTLAIKGDRNIYDETKVHLDKLNHGVALLVKGSMALTICIEGNPMPRIDTLFVSGRSENCRKETAKWIADGLWIGQEYVNEHLFMRAAGDTRPDNIVKLELFDKHIRHNYNVQAVLDDRDQVVYAWRSIGLQCHQVAPGNF